jgi:hypothetical protein
MFTIVEITGGFGHRVSEPVAFLLSLFVVLCVPEQVRGRNYAGKVVCKISKDILKVFKHELI